MGLNTPFTVVFSLSSIGVQGSNTDLHYEHVEAVNGEAAITRALQQFQNLDGRNEIDAIVFQGHIEPVHRACEE